MKKPLNTTFIIKKKNKLKELKMQYLKYVMTFSKKQKKNCEIKLFKNRKTIKLYNLKKLNK